MKFISRIALIGVVTAVNATAFAVAPQCNITPEPGSIVDRLSQFTIEFPEDVQFDVVTFYDDARPGNEGKDWNYNDKGHNDTIPGVLLVGVGSEKEFACKLPQGVKNETGGITYDCPLKSEWGTYTTESGPYLLTISNMYRMEDGKKVPLDPITASYNIPYPFDFVLDPPVATAENLQDLKIIFPGQTISYPAVNRVPVGTLQGPRTVYECEAPAIQHTEDGNSILTFKFKDAHDPEDAIPETITAAGEYKLTVRFLYSPEKGGLSWIYERYVLSGTGSSAETQMKPAKMVSPANSYTSYLAGVQLSWNDALLELVSPSSDLNEMEAHYSTVPAYVELTGDETRYPAYPYLWMQFNPGGGRSADGIPNSLMIDFDTLLESYNGELPNGTYTVTIPANIVRNNQGLTNPEQTFVLNKMSLDTEEPYSEPPMRNDNFESYEYTANELACIKLSWGGILSHVEDAPDITIGESAFNAPDPIPAPFGSETVSLSNDRMALQLDLSTLSAGNWEIVIPEGYLIINTLSRASEEMINGEVTLNYVIVEGGGSPSGCPGIEADGNGLYTIYTIDGVRVAADVDSAVLDTLKSGLYVINGVKVLIRK